MPDHRTEIRDAWKAILEGLVSGSAPVEIGRRHKVSSYPSVQIKSGSDVVDFDETAPGVQIRRYSVFNEVFVSSLTADDEIDVYVAFVRQGVTANGRHTHWKGLQLGSISEPEDIAGKKDYAKVTIEVIFTYIA